MPRSSARTPFTTDHGDLSADLQDKSADVGLEVKDLADDEETDTSAHPDLDAILEPEGWEPPETLTAEEVLALAGNPDALGSHVLSADEPAPVTVETVAVVMIHHYEEYVPKQTVVLDARTAASWVSSRIAKYPTADED